MRWLLRFYSDGSARIIEILWGFCNGSVRGLWWLLRFHEESVRGLWGEGPQWLLMFCKGLWGVCKVSTRCLQGIHDGSLMVVEVPQGVHNGFMMVLQGLLRFYEGSTVVLWEVCDGFWGHNYVILEIHHPDALVTNCQKYLHHPALQQDIMNHWLTVY